MRSFFLAPFFLLLGLAISGAAGASPGLPPGPSPSLTIGGRVFTDLTNLITLECVVSGNASNCTFKKGSVGGSAGYLPSGSKTFHALAMRVFDNSSSAQCQVNLGYSDNDLGSGSASAFTNGVFFVSATAWLVTNNGPGDNPKESAFDFTVPNGKYVATQSGGATQVCTIFLYGYEK